MWRLSAIVVAAAAAATLSAQSPRCGVGRPPTPDEMRELGSAIAPDGTGLPAGSGTVAAGRELFAAQCARCHGPNGRRRRRCEAGRRARDARDAAAAEDGRQLLAVRDDAVGLRQSGDAIRSPGSAVAVRGVRGGGLRAEPERHHRGGRR